VLAKVGNPQSANSSSIFFAINTGITLIGNTNSAQSFCQVSAPGGFKLGGTTDAKTMNFHTWRKVATNTAQTDVTKSFISFVKGVGFSVVSADGNYSPNKAMIDVATGSQKVTGTVSTLLAALGKITYKATTAVAGGANTYSAVGGTLIKASAQSIQGSVPYRVTVTGAPLAGASRARLVANAALTLASACDKGTFGVSAGVSAQLAQFFVSGAKLEGGLTVCVQYSGTTNISAGQITATLSKGSTEASPWNYDFSTTNNQLHEMKKNGLSFKLYNMNLPESLGGSTVEVSNIRLYNTSSKAGAVRATVFGSDGVRLGTAGGIVLDSTTFAPKTAHVVSMTTLLSTLGITAYTGAQRPWILLEGEVPEMDVQVVTRNKTTGVVVNMSPVTRVE
jgi:hypothetical protein